MQSLTWKAFFLNGGLQASRPGVLLPLTGRMGCMWETDQVENQTAALHLLFGPLTELAPPVSLQRVGCLCFLLC